MKRVLIIDTETTGLDPATDVVIEVGCILYSLDHATVIECFSSLIRAESNGAEGINRIPTAALAAGRLSSLVWSDVRMLAAKAEVFIGHNCSFDRAFAPEEIATLLPWCCSYEDIEWPLSPPGKLTEVALNHGLGVADAHRALTDCLLIARLLTRCHELGHDLQAMLTRAMRPKALIRGLQRFEDNQLAKDAGFRWDGERKWWLRRMFLDDAAALTFPWRIVEEDAA